MRKTTFKIFDSYQGALVDQEGWATDLFGVHKLHTGPKKEFRYVLTHLPTGLHLPGYFFRLDKAKDVAERLTQSVWPSSFLVPSPGQFLGKAGECEEIKARILEIYAVATKAALAEGYSSIYEEEVTGR